MGHRLTSRVEQAGNGALYGVDPVLALQIIFSLHRRTWYGCFEAFSLILGYLPLQKVAIKEDTQTIMTLMHRWPSGQTDCIPVYQFVIKFVTDYQTHVFGLVMHELSCSAVS